MKDKQPRQGDMVLGGKNLPPKGAAVLGGIIGILQKLKSENEQEKIAALAQALNYGDPGLDLVIEALTDKSFRVRKVAYLLLWERQETKVKEVLRNTNPYQFFECIDTIEEHIGTVTSLAITPDGKTLVSGSWDKTIKIWDLNTKLCLSTLKGHSQEVTSLAITPDGKTLVSGSWDKTIKIWDLNTKHCLSTLKGHLDWVSSLATSNGKTLVSGRIWDLNTKHCLSNLKKDLQQEASLAITPDGKILVSGNGDKIKIWDLNTKLCLSTLKGHSQEVTSLAITPDGKTLISGSFNRIYLWGIPHPLFSF